MVRPPSVDSNGMKKGAWSEDEDNKLRAYIQRYGHWNWRLLPRFAGLQRCGKSCRLRWVNYLKPGVKRGNFSKEEQELVIKLHLKLGNKWSAIAEKLPGRTDNEIKNFWHTRVERRRKQPAPLDNQKMNPIIIPKADDNIFLEMTTESSPSESSFSSSSSSLSLPFHYNNLPSPLSTNPQHQLEVMLLSQILGADDSNHSTFAPLPLPLPSLSLNEAEGEFDYPELRFTGLSSSYVDNWSTANNDVCGSFWNETSSSESDSSNYAYPYPYAYTDTTPVQEEGLVYNYNPLLTDPLW